MVSIGYCIGRTWWHKGITSEALKAVMDFLFDVVEVKRIEARPLLCYSNYRVFETFHT